MKHHPAYYLTQAILVFSALILLWLVMMVTAVFAQQVPEDGLPDQASPLPHGAESVIAITRLNSDAVDDTLVGITSHRHGHRISRILWGESKKHGDVAMENPGRKSVPRTTTFNYGFWTGAPSSVSVLDLNSDGVHDVLIDVMWNARGSIQDGAHGSARKGDTSQLIGVLGGDDLANTTRVHLDQIRQLQIAPFHALSLSGDHGLAEPARRDLTGTTSYVLPPVIAKVPQEEKKPDSTTTGDITLDVHPNPTHASVTVEATGLLQGRYRITIATVDGTALDERTLAATTYGRIVTAFDLSSYPAGYYRVQLLHENQPVLSAPVLVLH